MGIRKWFSGPPSANYQRVEWFPTAIDPEEAKNWPSYPGHGRALGIAGLWIPSAQRAGIFVVRSSVMDGFRRATPGAEDGVAIASATAARGRVWAGILPVPYARWAGTSFDAGEAYSYELVGAKIGSRAVRLVPVRVYPDTRQVILPAFGRSIERLGPEAYVPALPRHYDYDGYPVPVVAHP